MPVTIKTAEHGAEIISPSAFAKKAVRTDDEALPQACQADFKEMMQCGINFEAPDTMNRYIAAENAFFAAAKLAYCHHHHLVLRPDDIWFAILTQVSSYVNKHAEELRDRFVSHEDKKKLILKYGGNRYDFDYTIFISDMNVLIQKNILDPDLREWILPTFSTSTENDVLVASVIMMATLQKYFEFEVHFMCGIPSITLLGEKSDWELLFSKLEKLKSFGQEPAVFHDRLVPVISRMVKTFDDPSDPDTTSFWQRMLKAHSGMSGGVSYSGWISAFSFWDFDGDLIHYQEPSPGYPPHALALDGIRYYPIREEDVAVGWCKAPVLCNDHGSLHDFIIAAGSTTVECSSSNPASSGNLDTLAPAATWFLYEKTDEESELTKKIAEAESYFAELKKRAHKSKRPQAPSPKVARRIAESRGEQRPAGTLRRLFCCGI